MKIGIKKIESVDIETAVRVALVMLRGDCEPLESGRFFGFHTGDGHYGTMYFAPEKVDWRTVEAAQKLNLVEVVC
ncbi:hypothetical protein NKH14_06820 [Mesorhizobium sp. M1380]|uniref:hypothetical protein n=1 Tax=Mesorhizobium sp. M1380 TaxID=2957093 RepID=UPI0033399E92